MTAPRRRTLLIAAGLLVSADIALLALLALPGGSARALPDNSREGVRSYLFTAMDASGLPAALDSLERLAETDSFFLRKGHQLAHALGRRAVTTSGGDAAVLAQCRPTFGAGCYHGVVEALLTLRRRVDMAELEDMCLAAARAGLTRPVYECSHGLGHGVLGAVGLDVPLALRHCDSLTRPHLAVACHQGVFMEAITVALADPRKHAAHSHGSSEHGAAAAFTIDETNPYSPCDRFQRSYAYSCWLFQAFVILRGVGFDAGRALRICDAVPAGRADRCYESVGHQLAGLFQRGDAWVTAQCGKGSPDRAARCASGAALALVAMDWSGERVRRYCASLPTGWRGACSRTAAEELALVS